MTVQRQGSAVWLRVDGGVFAGAGNLKRSNLLPDFPHKPPQPLVAGIGVVSSMPRLHDTKRRHADRRLKKLKGKSASQRTEQAPRLGGYEISGETQELGQSFNRPGVGILADGPDTVLVIDYGASGVRRVLFDGKSRVVVDGLAGSAVAMGSASNGDLLVGTWARGNLYRLP